MPASILQSLLAIGPLAAGATSVVAHGLRNGTRALVPTLVWPDRNTGIVAVSVDATNVTFRNDGAAGESSNFLAQFDHTIQAANTGVIALLWKGNSGVLPLNAQAMTFRQDGLTVNVFVDQINGSDTNDGLTVGTALASIPAVYEKFSWQLMGTSRLIINLLNGTAAQIDYVASAIHVGGGNLPLLQSYVYRGPAMIQIIPATGPATAALDGTPAVRVDQTNAGSGTGNRTRLDFTGAAPGWTINDLAGFFLRVTRGAVKVFHELPITQNTADTLTVDTLGIVGVLLAGDTVELVEPAVSIVGDASNFGVTAIIGQPTVDTQLAILDPVTNGSTFERIRIQTVFAGGVFGLTFDRCHAEGSSFNWTLIGGTVAFVNTAFKSNGLQLTGGSGSPTASRDDAAGNPIDSTPATGLQIAGLPAFRDGLFIGTEKFSFPRFAANYVINGPPLSVYDANDQGIDVRGPDAVLWVGEATAVINGARNGDYGIRCSFGALARINGGVLTTITGTLGDLGLGPFASKNTIPYGTGVGGFEEVIGWNGNAQRVPITVGDQGDLSRITTQPPQDD